MHFPVKVQNMSKKQKAQIGLPPGSLVYTGEPTNKKIDISIINYGVDTFIECDHVSIEECLERVPTSHNTWIHVRGVYDPHIIERIGKKFDIHSLVLEDVMNIGHSGKLDASEEYIFIILKMLNYDSKTNKIADEQFSIIFGRNYILTFSENSSDIFETIRNRLQNSSQRLRSLGPDYLAYSLMDYIVDRYFLILEIIDTELEELEELLVRTPSQEIMRKIQQMKRQIILLRKSVWPTREVINKFSKLETPLINSTTQFYMRDVYDHTIQAIDTIESFRDIASGMLDIYLSNMSQRMNEIMKLLTIVATIFVPLTFLASLYGMNFDYMPELHMRWGYPVLLLSMICMAIGMLYYFRRKHWI